MVHSENQASCVTSGDTLRLWAAGDLMVVDTTVARSRNLSLEFTVVPGNDRSHIGAVVRYVSPRQWIYVGCDLTSDILGYSNWYVVTPQGRQLIATDIAKLYADYPRRVRVDCVDETLQLRVDGEKVAHVVLPWRGYDQAGWAGFRVWDGGEAEIYDVKATGRDGDMPVGWTRFNDSPTRDLNGERLGVDIFRGLPEFFRWDKKHGIGTGAKSGWVFNGERYEAEVDKPVRMDDSTMTTRCRFPQIGVEVDVRHSVCGNVYEWRVTDIRETGDFRIRTIDLGENYMASLSNDDPAARLSVAWDEGRDEFWKLSERKTDTVPVPAAIVILNNEQFAVTLDNNSQYESKQFLFQNDGRATSIGSNEWIYRGPDGLISELPCVRVIFADDVNGDGRVTWQDGAVALAEVYPEPYGVEEMRNANATITMNFASEGQYPFLRQLDNIKKVYYLTDGFGQMVELKGYQSEGHDSAHPDYAGHYNRRAGGLGDLRILIEQAKKYNARIGLHINRIFQPLTGIRPTGIADAGGGVFGFHARAVAEAVAAQHLRLVVVPGNAFAAQVEAHGGDVLPRHLPGCPVVGALLSAQHLQLHRVRFAFDAVVVHGHERDALVARCGGAVVGFKWGGIDGVDGQVVGIKLHPQHLPVLVGDFGGEAHRLVQGQLVAFPVVGQAHRGLLLFGLPRVVVLPRFHPDGFNHLPVLVYVHIDSFVRGII